MREVGAEDRRHIQSNGLDVRRSGGLTDFMITMLYNVHRYYSAHVRCYLMGTVNLNKEGV